MATSFTHSLDLLSRRVSSPSSHLARNRASPNSQASPHAMVTVKGAEFLACCIICLVVSWIAVPLRCYARRRVIARLAAEDWLMVVAQVLFTIELFCCFFQVAYGVAKHMQDVDNASIQKTFILLFIGFNLYATVMMLARVSIGFLLMRLMVSKAQKIAVWSVLGLNVAAWIMYVVWTFNICTPLQKFWLWTSPIGTCHQARYAIGSYIHSASAVVTDWTLSIIPMFVLWKSTLPHKTRIATAGILSLGAFASISTMIRLLEVKRASDEGAADFLYTITDVLTWSVAEQGLAIAAGCFATYRPLFFKVPRQANYSDGTRGRPGRPIQPGDTQVDWDPGLTIGFIGSADEEVGGKFGQMVRRGTHEADQEIRSHDPARSHSWTPLHIEKKKDRKSVIVIATEEGLV
ncbi:hypothetical protein CAC42_7171 [Sphaceloma murrayae]|uniref:Rhodopsin domain-containing protein n=1 Tax=Sphaceloma murrayae TaxID=2082308 RepID=A0A2K1QPU8_9PEZI|nr:hypothetical protein CAC42_7171 [Sphaceloma murrayae]